MKTFIHREAKDFSSFLMKKRIEVGLTQAEVAKTLKFPSGPQTVSNWERGTSRPPKAKLRALAELYNMSFEELADEYIISALTETQEKLKSDFYPNKTMD